MNENSGIDFDVDFYNAGHLNPVGMRKMTACLGGLLAELGCRDHRGEPEAAEWLPRCEDFTAYRIEQLKSIADAKTYLMSLNDPDLFSGAEAGAQMLEDPQVSRLLERLKDAGNSAFIPEESFCGIRCTVYRRSSPGEAVHSAGF